MLRGIERSENMQCKVCGEPGTKKLCPECEKAVEKRTVAKLGEKGRQKYINRLLLAGGGVR